jgi:hypothetical protein
MAQFGDLSLVAVVEMLAGAKQFHGGNALLLNPRQQRRREPVIYEQVRGQ